MNGTRKFIYLLTMMALSAVLTMFLLAGMIFLKTLLVVAHPAGSHSRVRMHVPVQALIEARQCPEGGPGDW